MAWRTKFIGVGIGCVVATSLAATPASSDTPPNLLRNGGFERPHLEQSFSYRNFEAGTRVEGWTVSGAAVSVANAETPTITPFRGDQFISLVKAGSFAPGAPAGTLCQTVKGLEVGKDYAAEVHIASLYQPVTFLMTFGPNRPSYFPVPSSVSSPTRYFRAMITTHAWTTSSDLCIGTAAIPATGFYFPLIDGVSVRQR